VEYDKHETKFCLPTGWIPHEYRLPEEIPAFQTQAVEVEYITMSILHSFCKFAIERKMFSIISQVE